ncbi:dUTP diphosphatase [Liquorilactobacillus oeni]|uniref:dUTP diphosphatase n=1 Tax=Liquorilactobacillus oeni TaxID=303241 RepID=UPI00070DB907|nr:dUTP diphosphatase [Liquorilactobacillus oeni]
MKRGFEIVSKYVKKGLRLPVRATQNAAGYDFYVAEDFVIPSIWKLKFIKILWKLATQKKIEKNEQVAAQKVLKPFLVPTGIKAYMQPNEFLLLANRSSNPLKRSLVLPNGVGIVDADYYNNPNNEGEIFFQLINFGIHDLCLKKGERVGQGIFVPFLLADGEEKVIKKRTGGFGSSGR